MKTLVARVAVSAAVLRIDKPYSYKVPDIYAGHAVVGQRVIVPFGKGNRKTMQKVERRRHRQKGRGRLTGLLLCLLLLAVCVTAAFLLRRKAVEKPPEARQRATGAVTRRNREDLESITLIPRDGEGWTAVMRTDGKLQLSAGDGDTKGQLRKASLSASSRL